MRGRIAPRSGYDFGNKRQYRRNVWAWVARFIKHNRGLTDVALLPSSEGDEIEVALSNGFRQHHIHIIDKNPAIVALLKRKYPFVNTYGVDVVTALRRMAKAGVELKFINLDLCGTIVTTIKVLHEIANMGEPFADHHAVAVTLFRGRDPGLEALAKKACSGVKVLDSSCECEDECKHMRDQTLDDFLQYSEAYHGLTRADAMRAELIFEALTGESWSKLTATDPVVYKSVTNSMMYRIVERMDYEPAQHSQAANL